MRFWLSFIRAIKITETTIIVKKVISTVKLDDKILNNFGSAMIAIVVPARDIPAVSPFSSVTG